MVFQVSCIDAGDDQEIFSFSYGGAGDNLLAGGCKEQVRHLNQSLVYLISKCLIVVHFEKSPILSTLNVPVRYNLK